MAYIYVIKNDINNKVYIGKTNFSIEKRFEEHCRDSKKHRNEKRPLYNAMTKYGVEHFYIEKIEECSREEASCKEKFWINRYDSYQNGYNATVGGDGKNYLDYQKILKLYDNTTLTEKEIASAANCCVDSVRNIVSQYRNNPNWLSRYYNTSEHKETLLNQPVKVMCLEEGKQFCSTTEAANWLVENKKVKSNNCRTHISACCKGKRKTCGGYHWKYL